MISPAKYLFDNDFALATERKSSVALAEHAARLRAEGALPPPRKKSRRR